MTNSLPSLHKPCSGYTDDDLVSMIKAGGGHSRKAFNCLYELYFDMVRMSVKYHRLEKNHILDAYTQALLSFHTSILAGKWERRGTLRAFFAIIFRFKCIDTIRSNPTISLDAALEEYLRKEAEDGATNPEEIMIGDEEHSMENDRAEIRKRCLEEASGELQPREMEILTDYFVNNYKAKDLAEKYGYKNAGVAKTTAYNLKNKLNRSIRELCEKKPECRIICP
ncbi:MAG: sigma-70 family RNA polymerase sigma factor [Lewinellaceae bacterium]|nr:sigma-70 family RNA polymerase sigma factor [Saprospiraceae bacterium]MCB9308302.1 sigma-70 family RNA polymerase sigma factor [Lewinellaceae bacterium]MCB9353524.1 sigma-70 family RNA polymerase sigma factor [Lewinellaceae bacterium]